jgi:hypothetical protein
MRDEPDRLTRLWLLGVCAAVVGLLRYGPSFGPQQSPDPTDEPAIPTSRTALPYVNMTKFNQEGYVLVDGVFSAAEVDQLRRDVRQRVRAEATPTEIGPIIPDFMARPSFAFMHHLPTKGPLIDVLQQVFRGEKFRYCGHNDIGINRIVGWHKDRLNDAYANYQQLPLWGENQPDGGHKIVKVALYLQDHADDPNALIIVPRSFNTPSMATDVSRRLHPRKGQVLIFEQRSTHRGGFSGRKRSPGEAGAGGVAALLQAELEAGARDDARILVSLGYGLDNNHTREFEAGTLARQADQCGARCLGTSTAGAGHAHRRSSPRKQEALRGRAAAHPTLFEHGKKW